jgi:DNA-binding response OmpR family regulator
VKHVNDPFSAESASVKVENSIYLPDITVALADYSQVAATLQLDVSFLGWPGGAFTMFVRSGGKARAVPRTSVIAYEDTMRLLIVEDDRGVAEVLQRGLLSERMAVDLVHDGQDGLDMAVSGSYDALILDLMLPGMGGLEVARELRAGGVSTPILMLTAKDTLNDRLRGFGAGADDYLCKPFAFAELLARLRAIMRRGTPVLADDRLVVGDLVLDRGSHEVTREGRQIHLSPKEFAVLEYLMENVDRVLSRTLILERGWDYAFDSFGNVVDVTIRRLRKAVDEGYEHQLIHTVRTVGYKIKTPP